MELEGLNTSSIGVLDDEVSESIIDLDIVNCVIMVCFLLYSHLCSNILCLSHVPISSLSRFHSR